MAIKLILIRHGALAEAHRGQYIGSTDAPLSREGRKQAKRLAAVLYRRGNPPVFCSPLSRCRETALLALGGQEAFAVDPDLREIDFGRWEGMTFAQIAARDPAAVDRWADRDEGFAFPGGEEIAAFHARIAAVAGRIAAHPTETVVAVTHGGVIRSLICHFLGLGVWDTLLFEVDPASVSELRIEGGRGCLSLLNDRHHLQTEEG